MNEENTTNNVNTLVELSKWEKTRKIFKSKKFYIPTIILLLIIVGLSYSSYQKSHQPPVYEMAKVEQGLLKQSVEATGNVDSVDALSLRFETAGTLDVVRAKEGMSVRAGALLANLRMADLNASVAQASANLNQKLAGNTFEYISQLQSSLDKARADLSAIQGPLPGSESSKLVQNAYDDAVATLQSTQVIISSALISADNILGVDNTFANDDYENVLSTLSPDFLNNAKNNYYATKIIKNNFDVAVNNINDKSEHYKINSVMDQGKVALSSMKDLLFKVLDVLNATYPGNNLSTAELDDLKTGIQTARTNVATKYAGLLDEYHAIDTARNSYYSYEALVAKAEAALKDAQNPPRDVDVAYYRATLAAAVANRNKAILLAPIDGIVTKVNKKRGEFVSSADVAIEMLSPHYEIKVDIPETDVSKLKLNDLATITLDAFDEDIKFTGKIISIDPASTDVQDVVYYQIRVGLDDTDKPIKPGMTANVTVTTASVDDALFMPTRAIRTNTIGKYVRVLVDEREVEKPVQVGIKGDDGKTQILSGLSVGEEIIVNIKS